MAAPLMEPELAAVYEEKRPVWQEDRVWAQCGEAGCGIKFGFTVRKHHCRSCGYVFCHEHSKQKIAISAMGYKDPVRVCHTCHDKLTRAAAAAPSKQ